jgi:hypothetical protein
MQITGEHKDQFGPAKALQVLRVAAQAPGQGLEMNSCGNA